jgi:hypothetical protein
MRGFAFLESFFECKSRKSEVEEERGGDWGKERMGDEVTEGLRDEETARLAGLARLARLAGQ